MLISVTHFKLQHIGLFPPFCWHTLLSTRQAGHSPGLLYKDLRVTSVLDYWTLTAWAMQQDMLNYRNSGRHLKAMQNYRRLGTGWVGRYESDVIPTW